MSQSDKTPAAAFAADVLKRYRARVTLVSVETHELGHGDNEECFRCGKRADLQSTARYRKGKSLTRTHCFACWHDLFDKMNKSSSILRDVSAGDSC